MSRVGVKPVAIPDGVKVSVAGRTVTVESGPKKLTYEHRPEVTVAVEGTEVKVVRKNDDRLPKALHGLTRALIQNMIVGVTKGYEKKLEIVGVGYLAALAGKVLQLRVGFANEIHLDIPEGVVVKVVDPTHVTISGIDKQAVGQFAAEVRSVRKPEPYKGKGIRYEGEQVRRKAGKAVTK